MRIFQLSRGLQADSAVFCRYHGQFITVARRRYLGATEQHRQDIHSTLAHYYLGTWSQGRCKPFRYSKKQLRCVSGTGKNKGKPRKLEDEADRLVTISPSQGFYIAAGLIAELSLLEQLENDKVSTFLSAKFDT